MRFGHHPEIWTRFPELRAAVLHARGIRSDVDVTPHLARFNAVARERLEQAGSESELPQVQAWRRAFQRMGLKPTQYRCASESLLRRFRKEGDLPRIHPLIDVCNTVSIAFGIPVAALDVSRIAWPLQVRPARGDEVYVAFSGETEHPDAGEVTFADAANQAHARRWTHRQSGFSAVRDDTREVLIVAEALHADAAEDTLRLGEQLAQAIQAVWPGSVPVGQLTGHAPHFDFG
jgi:DNA/RNA-binding domain of Phe-tRNA-synthetase-like protein